MERPAVVLYDPIRVLLHGIVLLQREIKAQRGEQPVVVCLCPVKVLHCNMNMVDMGPHMRRLTGQSEQSAHPAGSAPRS